MTEILEKQDLNVAQVEERTGGDIRLSPPSPSQVTHSEHRNDKKPSASTPCKV